MKLQLVSMRRRLLAGVLALASTGPASAHDVWLTLSGDAAGRRVIINYGHPDDRPPAFADKVIDIFAISSGERRSLLDGLEAATESGIPVAKTKVFADDGHTLIVARYDNGFWVKTGDGLYRNATRRLVPDAADSLWSGKFAKALTGPGAPWQQLVGHALEILPLSDPAKATPGTRLRVKVLFRGEPLAGAEVERGDGVTAVPEKDIPRFKTDAEGIASIEIVKPGQHLLVIDHKVTPSATPDQANVDLYNATLWFSAAE